jgi:hypothetical protein
MLPRPRPSPVVGRRAWQLVGLFLAAFIVLFILAKTAYPVTSGPTIADAPPTLRAATTAVAAAEPPPVKRKRERRKNVPVAVSIPAAPASAPTVPRSLSSMPCPKIFMYDYKTLPIYGMFSTPHRQVSAQLTLGARINSTSLYEDTNHHELVNYFVYRLRRSAHCKLTKDPAKADLFFVAAMPGRKVSIQWRRMCNSSKAITTATAQEYLPHLNPYTASRHVALVANGVVHVSAGGACAWLRAEEPLFASVQRYAYTGTLVGLNYSAMVWPQDAGWPPQLDGSRFLSVPVLSSVHWSTGSEQPWADPRPRPLLMYFVGGFHGPHAALREKIFDDCSRLGLPLCRAEKHFSTKSLLAKRSAVFCLEPDGDSPWRKSYFDAITNGCIPVFFGPTTVEVTSPWHWAPRAFRDNSRLVLSAAAFMNGSLNLESLQQVPAERIAEMQRAIATHGGRLHYAAEDVPTGDDAFEILLKKAHLRAQGVPWDSPELLEL